MAKGKGRKRDAEGQSSFSSNGVKKMVMDSFKNTSHSKQNVHIRSSSESSLRSGGNLEASTGIVTISFGNGLMTGQPLSQVASENMRESNNKDQIKGFIFMCSNKTKPECFRYRVFGLPKGKLDAVKKVKPGAKLFLYDFDMKFLYGVYEATSNGDLNLEPTAFHCKFPSQVRFRIFKDCLPIPDSVFKHAIKENCDGGSKFRQELSGEQVKSLISLFRPIDVTVPAFLPTTHETNQHAPTAQVIKQLHPLSRPSPAKFLYMPTTSSHPPPVYRRGYEHSLSDLHEQYKPEMIVSRVQPAAECWRYLQPLGQPYGDSQDLEVHQPYFPEEPLLSTHDMYRRTGGFSGMVRSEQHGYQDDQYQMELRERDIVTQANHVANPYSQNNSTPPYAPVHPYMLQQSHGGLTSPHQCKYSVISHAGGSHTCAVSAESIILENGAMISSYQHQYSLVSNGNLGQAYAVLHDRMMLRNVP